MVIAPELTGHICVVLAPELILAALALADANQVLSNMCMTSSYRALAPELTLFEVLATKLIYVYSNNSRADSNSSRDNTAC